MAKVMKVDGSDWAVVIPGPRGNLVAISFHETKRDAQVAAALHNRNQRGVHNESH